MSNLSKGPLGAPFVCFLLGTILLFPAGGGTLALRQVEGGSSLPQEESLRKGQDLAQQGRLGDALEAYALHKLSYPEDPNVYYLTAITLRESGRLQEAAAELRIAVERSPERLEYRLELARTLRSMGQWQEAIRILGPMDGERLDEQLDPEAVWLLADLYYQNEAMEDSLRVLDRYDQLVPEDLRGPIRRGQIHLLSGDFEEATQFFRRASERAPQAAPVHHGLGLSEWRAGRYEAALSSLMRAVELDPDQTNYRLDLGRLLIERDRARDAIPHLDRLIGTESPPVEALYELARAHRRLGDTEKADSYAESFRDATSEEKEAEQLRERVSSDLRRGQDLLGEGRVAEARRAFEEAVRGDPDNWLAHSYLAKIFLSNRLWRPAGEHLARLQQIDPDSVEGNFLIATFNHRLGRHNKALGYALKSRKARPDNGEFRNLLGNIYLALGRRGEALQEYAAAVRLEPDRSDFRLNYEAVKKAPR